MSVKNINEHEFVQLIKHNNKFLVDFYANWCGPCKMLSPIIDEVSNIKKDWTFLKINVDENHNLANQYGVFSIPTILIFKDGGLIKKIIGFHSKEKIIQLLSEL